MQKQDKEFLALLRYSVIVPLVTGIYEGGNSKKDFFREAASRDYSMPDGSRRSFSADTIERWYYSYKKYGFDALLPESRSDEGESRKLDNDMKRTIAYYVGNYPRMSATSIYHKMIESNLILPSDVSETTIRRYIRTIRDNAEVAEVKDMRRYERSHINEVWCGDSSVSVYIKENNVKKRVYVIALIDDASRMIVGIDAFFNDNFENLLSVMKSAVSKFGVPQIWNFDNGSNYRNKQVELLAARIGSCVNYCKPFTPTSKAKIERWFRTMKDQWSASINYNDFHSIDDVRNSLFEYVTNYNLSVHSSLNGLSPHDRFFSESKYIRRLSDDQIDKLFLLEDTRRVSADCVIRVNKTDYETDSRFAKEKVNIRYVPDMSAVYIEDKDGALIPVKQLNKHENALTKRKEYLFGGNGNG